MIKRNAQQGTQEWHEARLGIPTASCFSKIVTGKGKPSDQRESYMYDLAGSEIGIKSAFGGSAATERGHELEPYALEYYSILNDVKVEKVGFIVSDCGRFGGSPDGLVGATGGIEIKCCEEEEHLRLMASDVVPTKYRPQVYGLLWLSKRKWWDFVAYHPDHGAKVVRVKRSCKEYQDWIAAFVPRLNEFCERLELLKVTVAS